MQPHVFVTVTYKGEKITEDFLNNNLEIKALYPSDGELKKTYSELKQQTNFGWVSLIDVSENGVITTLNHHLF